MTLFFLIWRTSISDQFIRCQLHSRFSTTLLHTYSPLCSPVLCKCLFAMMLSKQRNPLSQATVFHLTFQLRTNSGKYREMDLSPSPCQAFACSTALFEAERTSAAAWLYHGKGSYGPLTSGAPAIFICSTPFLSLSSLLEYWMVCTWWKSARWVGCRKVEGSIVKCHKKNTLSWCKLLYQSGKLKLPCMRLWFFTFLSLIATATGRRWRDGTDWMQLFTHTDCGCTLWTMDSGGVQLETDILPPSW